MTYASIYENTFGKYTQDFPSIEDLLKAAPEGPVMDFGAGSGRLLPLFADRQAILVEQDADMLAILKDKVRSLKNVSILEKNALTTQVPDESAAAVVFAFNAIAEMAPQAFTLQEAARVLMPGGGLYLMICNPKTFQTSARGLQRTTFLNATDVSLSAETLPMTQVGPNYYQVHVHGKTSEVSKKWMIEHTYPPVSFWFEQLQSLGFEITRADGDFKGAKFDENTSLFLVLHARKVARPKLKPSLENSKMSEIAYDWMAPQYDDIMRSAEYAIPSWFKAQIASLKGLHPMALDLGCGTGLVGELLSEAGVKPERLFGIDVSAKMVEIARRKGQYTAVLQGDLSQRLPLYESLTFDMITAFGLLEFTEDLGHLFAQIHNALKIGGEAFLSFDLKVDKDVVEMKFPGGVLKRRPRSKDEILNFLNEHKLHVQEEAEVSGYKSPSTGAVVPYLLVRAKKRTL